tara:strand:+ start:286 stop:618 length:333 start_codon:yes stop_codon:yes gene_type:complete
MSIKKTTVTYFFEEDYKEIKPNPSPLQKISEQVKLKPEILSEKYRHDKEFKKISKWHKENYYEIVYIFKKCINIFRSKKISLNESPKIIYTDFVYMLYYKYHENIYIKDL